jgi:HEAT repeat protein
VHALRHEPDDAVVHEGLRRGLADPWGVVVAAAANFVAEREISGFSAELVAAWERLYADAVEADPNCVGKEACATALDRADHADPAPFRRGAEWVQMQPVMGGRVDVAGGLRARCVMALARFGGVDALMSVARGLADRLPPVRSAAAQALAYTGEPAAAAMALQKVLGGDDEPGVVADALGSLLALQPHEGLAVATKLLDGERGELAELIVLALGQSRLPEAVALLATRLETAFRAADRRVLLVALGLSRTPESRTLLLDRVRTAPAAEARIAIEALATQSRGEELRRTVEEAARGRGLDDAIATAFGEP